ncbi:MAG: hypothetical protein ACI392_08820 [Paludibacteraceae bacterium]
MHYVIIIVFIVAIILLQVKVFSATKKKLQIFKDIFPDAAYEEWQLLKDDSSAVRIAGKADLEVANHQKEKRISELEEAVSKSKATVADLRRSYSALSDSDDMQACIVAAQGRAEKARLQDLLDQLGAARAARVETPAYHSDNAVRHTIITSINNYLERNNSSTNDFHLIKDIVDRNCDAADDEIQTQIPVPLYCGLMGTMLGIIVGILYLWLSGDLDALLGITTTAGSGAGGIKALLGGVALAMISSIVGIALTTYGSWQAKQIKSGEESAKHNFLSWMQAELLPAMNTDAASAMRMMVNNLSAFNTTFAANTKELNDSLSHVAETTKGQAEILGAINDLKINRIAAANIEVYDKLKNCTAEIGQLGEFLSNVSGYLANVRALNQKLDNADARSRMIEDMATYFKQERANIDTISGIIARSMGDADSALQKSIEILKENVTKQNDELVQHMVEQNQRLVRVLDEQQSTLENRSQEMGKLISELTQLTEVKKTMSNLEKAMLDQNKKIDNLVRSISELAQLKTTGTVHPQNCSALNMMPKWLLITVATIIAVSFVWFNVWTVLSLL